jgi:LmbE family N-acetylglucosaminyl deacetylase
MSKVLVIAPHLDDEALGCGGTIIKHSAAGDEVYVAFVAHRVYDHEYNDQKMQEELAHMEEAMKILGYKEYAYLAFPDERLNLQIREIIIELEKYLKNLKPEFVYSPFYQDNSLDHRAVADAVRIIMRPASANFVKRWMLYETASTTEQSPPLSGTVFHPNYYVDISGCMEKKLEATSCYEFETKEFPHPRSPEALKALAVKRGTEAGTGQAEAFMLMREIVKI